MAEFDFIIDHHAGKDNVVPDALSRAQLPCTLAANISDILPPDVCDFLRTVPCFHIPNHSATSGYDYSNFSLSCLSLACSADFPTNSPQALLHSTAKKKLIAMPAVMPDPPTAVQSKDIHVLRQNLPQTRHWSTDLETLHPLNVDRVQFAQKQRADPWLGPLA